MIRQAPGFRGCKALEEASIKHKLFHIYLFIYSFISGPTQKGKGKDTPSGCNSINIFVRKKGPEIIKKKKYSQESKKNGALQT